MKITVKLIDYDIDLYHVDISGNTALHRAATAGHPDMVYLLLTAAGVHSGSKEWKHLSSALLESTTDDIDWQTIYTPNRTNSSPPIRTVHVSHTERGLIEMIQNISLDMVDAENDHKNTCLHYAAQNNKVNAMIALLNFDAETRLVNVSGQSALYMAILHRHQNIVDLLLTVGDVLNEREISRLHMGVRSAEEQMMFNYTLMACRRSTNSLVNLARNAIRCHLKCVIYKTTYLPLPKQMKDFVLLHNFRQIDEL